MWFFSSVIQTDNVEYTNTENSETLIEYYKPQSSGEIVSGGTVIYSTLVGADSRVEIDISNIDISLRPLETITIGVKELGTSSASIMARTINWIDDI